MQSVGPFAGVVFPGDVIELGLSASSQLPEYLVKHLQITSVAIPAIPEVQFSQQIVGSKAFVSLAPVTGTGTLNFGLTPQGTIQRSVVLTVSLTSSNGVDLNPSTINFASSGYINYRIISSGEGPYSVGDTVHLAVLPVNANVEIQQVSVSYSTDGTAMSATGVGNEVDVVIVPTTTTLATDSGT